MNYIFNIKKTPYPNPYLKLCPPRKGYNPCEQYCNQHPNTEYAPINSPHFTGIPTAPNPYLGNNSNQIATTSFVQNELNNYNKFSIISGQPTSSGGYTTWSMEIGNNYGQSFSYYLYLNSAPNPIPFSTPGNNLDLSYPNSWAIVSGIAIYQPYTITTPSSSNAGYVFTGGETPGFNFNGGHLLKTTDTSQPTITNTYTISVYDPNPAYTNVTLKLVGTIIVPFFT
jgi:hypothetical protein